MLLRTPRLLLREFSADDAPAVAAYHRDPRFQRFYPERLHAEREAHALVERFLAWQREEPRCRYQLAVALADPGEPIGSVGLRSAAAGARVADLGFELAPDHWGRGYATEAARALLEHGFGALGLHRVHAHCIADNLGSRRVLERLGMREEGRLREHEFFAERWWDVLLFGLLADEWKS